MDATDKSKIKIKAVGDTVSGIVYVTEKGSYLIDVNFRGYNDKFLIVLLWIYMLVVLMNLMVNLIIVLNLKNLLL